MELQRPPQAAAARALHPPRRAEDPARLAPVSARSRGLDRLAALDRKVGRCSHSLHEPG